MGVPSPFITLRREVECIKLIGLITLIDTAVVLFALICLDLGEVTMDKQICLLL